MLSGTEKDLSNVNIMKDKLVAVGENGIVIAYTIPTITEYTPRKQFFDEPERELPKTDAEWRVSHSGGDLKLHAASFINATEGWAIGDSETMLHTLDGGSSWQKVEFPLDGLVAVHFVSSEIGWALTEDATFLSTTNGGRMWWILNQTNKPTVEGIDKERRYVKEACQLYAAYFPAASQGWAVGKHGVILHNADGNMTWTHQENELSASYHDIQIVAKNYGWVVGALGQILWTNNRGGKWYPQNSYTGYDLYGLYFRDKSEGWVVGRDGIVLHTSNSGLAWTSVDTGINTHLYAVCFINQMEGWIVGQGGLILHTKDRGVTWEIEESGIDEDLYHVTYVEGLGVVALGANSTILTRKVAVQS